MALWVLMSLLAPFLLQGMEREDSMNLQLLQSKLKIDSHAHHFDGLPTGKLLRPHARQLVMPIYWLHVPKTNSAFPRSFLTLPYVCKNLSDEGKDIIWNTDEVFWGFSDSNPLEAQCAPDIPNLRSRGIEFGDHTAVREIYQQYIQGGHGVIVLRNPEQRLLSAWSDAHHSWPYEYMQRDPANISEFIKFVQGCTVKLLSRSDISNNRGTADHHLGDGLSSCGDPRPITKQELQFATSALRNDFQFVGILEDYSNSICLFHTRFGGDCTMKELGNSRSGNTSSDGSDASATYDIHVLKGWTDPYDGPLYSEGLARHKQMMRDYEIDASHCNKLCGTPT